MYPSSYPISARIIIAGLMALNVLAIGVALYMRGPRVSQPVVVYRIPEEHKEKAKTMLVDLVKLGYGGGWHPDHIHFKAWDSVSKVYGEPVVLEEKKLDGEKNEETFPKS